MVVTRKREWVCLLINQSCEKKGSRYLKKELKKIFGNDLEEVKVVVDEDLSEEGFYAFVRSRSYESHSSALISSHIVKKALPSCQNPVILSDEDVDEFVDSVLRKNIPSDLRVGDVVEVTNGYLSRLCGLVTGQVSEGVYRVFFKFYVRQFTEDLHISSLRYVANIFQHLKFPLTVSNVSNEKITNPAVRQAFREIVSENKLCRRKN